MRCHAKPIGTGRIATFCATTTLVAAVVALAVALLPGRRSGPLPASDAAPNPATRPGAIARPPTTQQPARPSGLTLAQWLEVTTALAPRMTAAQKARQAMVLRGRFAGPATLSHLEATDLGRLHTLLTTPLEDARADELLWAWITHLPETPPRPEAPRPSSGTPLPARAAAGAGPTPRPAKASGSSAQPATAARPARADQIAVGQEDEAAGDPGIDPSARSVPLATSVFLSRVRMVASARTLHVSVRGRLVDWLRREFLNIKASSPVAGPAAGAARPTTAPAAPESRWVVLEADDWLELSRLLARDMTPAQRAGWCEGLRARWCGDDSLATMPQAQVRCLVEALGLLGQANAGEILARWAMRAPLPRPLPLPEPGSSGLAGQGRQRPRLISCDLDGVYELEVEQVAEGHFVVHARGRITQWFMFRLEGVKDRTIRVDFRGVKWIPTWGRLNPVYCYASDPADLALYGTTAGQGHRGMAAETRPAEPARPEFLPSLNGSDIPDTSGQQWHFIRRVWRVPPETTRAPGTASTWPVVRQAVHADGGDDARKSPDTYSFVEHFTQDTVLVAWRYPYTPGYARTYMEDLARRIAERRLDFASVIDAGNSGLGAPLQVVKISQGTEEDEKRKPCLLIYAAEHGDEPDGSWACQGAIEFLLSDQPEAQRLRKAITFLVIPTLDPDGAARGVHERITHGFLRGAGVRRENHVWAAFFKEWVDAGKRLDLVLNLHNTGAGELPHVAPAVCDARPELADLMRWYQLSYVVREFRTARGYSIRDVAYGRPVYAWSRLGGYLHGFYGCPMYGYELNMQASPHLTLEKLRGAGVCLVRAAGDFLQADRTQALLKCVDGVRAARDARMARYGPRLKPDAGGAIQLEWDKLYREIEDRNARRLEPGTRPPTGRAAGSTNDQDRGAAAGRPRP